MRVIISIAEIASAFTAWEKERRLPNHSLMSREEMEKLTPEEVGRLSASTLIDYHREQTA